jgi:hypothetical protein
MSMNETGASPSSGGAVPTTGDFVDLHELSKGWKAAITRAKDPSTRYAVPFRLVQIIPRTDSRALVYTHSHSYTHTR